MERCRQTSRILLLVASIFSIAWTAACVSPIGEEVGGPPRNRGGLGDGGSDGEGDGGSAGSPGSSGGTSAGGKAGAAGKGGAGPGGAAGSAGAGGEETAGASGSEAAGGTEAGGTGGADPGGAGGGAGATGGNGGSTAGTGGSSTGSAGMGGTVVVENPCPRVRVNQNGAPNSNIRPEPSTSKPPVGTVYPGDIIDCLGKANGEPIKGDPNWYHVKSAAFDGWISGTLADCTKDK